MDDWKTYVQQIGTRRRLDLTHNLEPIAHPTHDLGAYAPTAQPDLRRVHIPLLTSPSWATDHCDSPVTFAFDQESQPLVQRASACVRSEDV